MYDSDHQSDVWAALPPVVIHGILWVPFLHAMLLWMPRLKNMFADFGMKLPLLTEWSIDLSDLMVECWPIIIVLWLVFLAVDGYVSYLLYRTPGFRWAYWLWFTFLAVVPLCAGYLVAFGILEPFVDLGFRLSR
jgi:type II secretory pathway component PulF